MIYVFTDLETFEQVNLNKDWVGDLILYLKENDNCHVVQFEDKPISIELPPMVELEGGGNRPEHEGRHRPGPVQAGPA